MTLLRSLPPIAHRGLHDVSRGIVENTASAFEAAIAAGYGIETDIQAATGGEPVIFHDERLERLTSAEGCVSDYTPDQLKRIPMRGTADRILTLAEFLALVKGRAPLLLEIKSAGRTDRTLERHVAEALHTYHGPVAIISFDPGSLAAMRHYAPRIPRGLSATRFWRSKSKQLSASDRFRLTHMLDIGEAKPDFLTYEVNDLAIMGPTLRRRFPDLPIVTWTVRTREERRKAEAFADGMIFEGFRPPAHDFAKSRRNPV
jgi:glycerophosphoryl diester phosphodiesterase